MLPTKFRFTWTHALGEDVVDGRYFGYLKFWMEQLLQFWISMLPQYQGSMILDIRTMLLLARCLTYQLTQCKPIKILIISHTIQLKQ